MAEALLRQSYQQADPRCDLEMEA